MQNSKISPYLIIIILALIAIFISEILDTQDSITFGSVISTIGSLVLTIAALQASSLITEG